MGVGWLAIIAWALTANGRPDRAREEASLALLCQTLTLTLTLTQTELGALYPPAAQIAPPRRR